MSSSGAPAPSHATRHHEGGGHPAAALGLSMATALIALAAVVLVAVNRPPWTVWQWFFVVDVADAVVYGVVGYVLLSRSRHPVAWIVAITAMGGGLAAVGAQWTELRAQRPEVPELELLQSAQSWAWVPGTLALMLVVPWLVRERAPGRIARSAAWAGGVFSVAVAVLRCTDPFPWPFDDPIMPLAIRSERWVTAIEDLVTAAYLITSIGGLIAAVALASRWMHLAPDARRGFGWLAVATGLISLSFVPLGLPADWTDFLPPEFTPLTHLASQLFFPGALLVAVLGQRLWGLRLAVSRTVTWTFLTAALVVGYVALIALSGLVLPDVQDGVEQVAVTAVLAGAIDPLRRFVQRRVDHLVHGDGTNPIRVVRRVGRSLGAGGSPTELLGGVLDDLVTSLRLRGATIDVAAAGATPRIVAVGDTPADADDSALVVPLVLDGEFVGGLQLWPRVGERIDGQTERTIAALTPLVAVAARLAATAVALTESRARLASARDEERRALRRELHDGLGPALAGVGYGLQATRNLLDTDPVAAGQLLDRLIGELDARVSDVRSLARELVPPVLLEDGLPAALAELAERQRMTGLTVDLDIGELPTIGTDLATTLYAIAVEALRNVVRHAAATACRVSLTELAPGQIRLAVSDDGVGIAPNAPAGVGTQSMRERADSLGARLSIGPAPAGGTLVEMFVDVARHTAGRS